MLPILQQANIARQNNFVLLTAEEWLWIVREIKNDYPGLTVGQLKFIVSSGIKGKYNKIQPAINAFTIFKWIEIEIESLNILNQNKIISR